MKKHLISIVLAVFSAVSLSAVSAVALHAEFPASAKGKIIKKQNQKPGKGVISVRLDNGLTVLLQENHAQPIVSVQVWVKTGSINETPETAGLSHFLEHLIFKGSAKYPGDAISRQVETQGGSINAGTSKEFTHFYIDIQKEAAEDAVRILADAMANASMPAADIEKERPVVIEEIRRHDDNPGSVLYDLFNEAAFRATPYRRSIIGTADIIANVTRDEILAYYHARYTPENMVVSIAGDFTRDAMLALVRETFGAQKQQIVAPDPLLIEPHHTAETRRAEKDVEHTYWLGGFIGPDITSDDQFAADITATILGGGRSSRLFRRLREKEQLVFSISSSFWSQRGSGALVVSAIFAPEKEAQVVNAIKEEFQLLQAEGPTAAELKRAREMIKSQWYFGLETSHDHAAAAGYWQMQGVPLMVDQYIGKIDAVSRTAVMQFLQKYYAPQGLSSAQLAPKKQDPVTEHK